MALVDPQRLSLEFTKLFINADLHLSNSPNLSGRDRVPTVSRNSILQFIIPLVKLSNSRLNNSRSILESIEHIKISS